MNDLERLRVEVDARRRVGEPHRATRRSEAVNRYLGAANYRDLNVALSGASGSAAARLAARTRSRSPADRRRGG